jgi:GNAT superfamily N-acetyltransferase
MEYRIIKMDTSDPDEQRIVKEVDGQYNDICHQVKKTKALKKIMFTTEWQQVEDSVFALAKEPLDRMRTESEHPVYSDLDNTLVVCMDGERILGFLGGVINAYDILTKHYEDPKLSSYDRTKYGSVYSYLVSDTAPEIPMSWIEIICVHPEGRGQNIAQTLIERFISYSKQSQQSDMIVVGLDIVGTVKGGINLALRGIYEGFGFDFSMPDNRGDIPLMFSGAQFAGKIV